MIKKIKDGVKLLAKDTFERKEMNSIQKWEFFQFKSEKLQLKAAKN